MYKLYTVPAADEVTAQIEVNKLLKQLHLETWQIKNFSPVHDKESQYLPDVPQYKIIVLLTADNVTRLEYNSVETTKIKKPAVKKSARKTKKAAPKKAAEQAKKVTVIQPADLKTIMSKKSVK